MIRAVLEVLPRIIAAMLLINIAGDVYALATKNIFLIMKQAPVETIALTISFALALVSLIIPTPIAYVFALVSYSTATRFRVSFLTPAALLSIGALAVIDHVKSFYRSGQERFVKIGKMGYLGIVLSLAVTMAIIVSAPLFATTYLKTLIQYLQTSVSKYGNTFLVAIASNPFFILSISLAIGVALYRIVTVLAEVVAFYVGGSRSTALMVLKSKRDVDIVMETPLTMVKSIVFSALFTPPIYSIVTLFPIDSNILRGVVASAIFIVIGYFMYRLERVVVIEPKTVLVLSTSMLIAIYIGGVAVSMEIYKNVLDALIKPSISTIMSRVANMYTSFYSDIILLFDELAKLFGVTP